MKQTKKDTFYTNGGFFDFKNDEEVMKFEAWSKLIEKQHREELAQAQQQERQRVIEEVERLLVDKSYPITDPDSIDYGKMLESPINEWNAELRKKLNQLKGSHD